MERTAGEIIRYWRRARGLSQTRLAEKVSVSFRHINYLENNKTRGSRDLLLRICEQLQLNYRAKNGLLVAAQYAPAHSEAELTGNEDKAVRQVLELILLGINPLPAMIIDRHLNVLMCNAGMERFIDTFAANPARLRQGGLTIPRLNFHSHGLRDGLKNPMELLEAHMGRVHSVLEFSSFDHEEMQNYRYLQDLSNEFRERYGKEDLDSRVTKSPHPVIPVELEKDGVSLRIFTVISTVGSPRDVTLSEVQIDSGYPLDYETQQFFVQGQCGDAITYY